MVQYSKKKWCKALTKSNVLTRILFEALTNSWCKVLTKRRCKTLQISDCKSLFGIYLFNICVFLLNYNIYILIACLVALFFKNVFFKQLKITKTCLVKLFFKILTLSIQQNWQRCQLSKHFTFKINQILHIELFNFQI